MFVSRRRRSGKNDSPCGRLAGSRRLDEAADGTDIRSERFGRVRSPPRANCANDRARTEQPQIEEPGGGRLVAHTECDAVTRKKLGTSRAGLRAKIPVWNDEERGNSSKLNEQRYNQVHTMLPASLDSSLERIGA